MESANSKWNARYAYSGGGIPAPAQVLSQGVRWLPDAQLRAGLDTGSNIESDAGPDPLVEKRALDLACGRAGNGHYLAERGFHVCAWDVSDRVIGEIRARQPTRIAEAMVRDVSLMPPAADSFDVIVVSRFLDRQLCPSIARALKPDGVLFYQTFVHGLSNKDYLLAPNELLSLFSSLHVLEYHEPQEDADGKAEAQLVARRRAYK